MVVNVVPVHANEPCFRPLFRGCFVQSSCFVAASCTCVLAAAKWVPACCCAVSSTAHPCRLCWQVRCDGHGRCSSLLMPIGTVYKAAVVVCNVTQNCAWSATHHQLQLLVSHQPPFLLPQTGNKTSTLSVCNAKLSSVYTCYFGAQQRGRRSNQAILRVC